MKKPLQQMIEAFRKWAAYDGWRIDPDGELTMTDKGEPFGKSEYIEGSPIKLIWKGLQAALDRENQTKRRRKNKEGK